MSRSRSISADTRKGKVAIYLADGKLSDEKIAKKLGISRTTVSRIKADPDFQDHLEQLITLRNERLQRKLLSFDIANKTKRVGSLDDLRSRHLQAIEMRAERFAPLVKDTPELNADPPAEAATGLFVRTETINARGYSSIEWAYDASLVKGIESLQEQAAKELGQIVDKRDVTVGGSLRRDYVIVHPDDAE